MPQRLPAQPLTPDFSKKPVFFVQALWKQAEFLAGNIFALPCAV
jgi:hypothetical protein